MPDRSSPIAVFAFNRPDHLRRSLQSLVACDGFGLGPVTLFCDGPRSDGDREAVAATLDVARDMLGSAADIRPAEQNRGIFQSVTQGVTALIGDHGRVIVLEDDLVLAPAFLTFMNDALHVYADDPQVMQVSGYMFDVPEFAVRDTAVMLPFTSSWGWATWGRAWAQFDHEATGWSALLRDRRRRRQFNLGGVYDYATMLRRQMTDDPRKWDWDIRWYLTVFRADGRVIFPPRSLVRNIGQDGTGTHGRALFRNFQGHLAAHGTTTRPIDARAGAFTNEVWRPVQKAIWRQNGGWLGSAVDVVKRALRR